ncbi:MAG: reverse transcriptase family protein [Clostridiales bacterium]|jgi:hypothetical protein|nr:reverse transcriptase family protein [Clostridiales bacterium]
MDNIRQNYRDSVKSLGKKDFTFLKMQEYGFWPENLPTPYERQQNESEEDYIARERLFKEHEQVMAQLESLYKDKDKISAELRKIKNQYNQTWDYEKIRKDIAKQIMKESIARRAERKKQKALDKGQKTEAWLKHKSEEIVFIGKGYSSGLSDKATDELKLISLNLPVIKDCQGLASTLGIEYKNLRLLAYHRDVVTTDNYSRYTIPKKNGGERNIAAPKPILKFAQRKILELILEKVRVSNDAHGFLKTKSVVTGAKAHIKKPALLIKIDLENFFPTITFERVRGMFKSFGYSGYISSLLAMVCTYCERMPIEINGQAKYIKTSARVLPQGAPSSPMITNILCRGLDKKMNCLSKKYNFSYSRYADDMSFSFNNGALDTQKIIFEAKCIVSDEGFKINTEKTRYLKPNNRQCVTGVTINNNELGVPKIWVKKLRAAIYNANKLPGKVPGHTINQISGMASWLNSVNNIRYRKIIDEARGLIEKNKKA